MLHFAGVTERDKKITIVNRRMEREETLRKSNASRQARFRNARSNATVASPLPVPVPVPVPVPKKRPPIVPHVGDGFEQFWSSYPKCPHKVGKGAARKIWAKIGPSLALTEAILASLATQKRWEQWAKDGGQFIPMPATWLNQSRWEDAGIDRGNGQEIPRQKPQETPRPPESDELSPEARALIRGVIERLPEA